MKDLYLNGKKVKSACFNGKQWYSSAPAYGGLCLTSLEDGNEISLVKYGSPAAITLKYSSDGQTWNNWIEGQTVVTLDQDEKVYFRTGLTGDMRMASSSSAYRSFSFSKRTAASGDIRSLQNQDYESTSILSHSFYKLFSGSRLVTADLKMDNLFDVTMYGLCSLFEGCTELTTGPSVIKSNGALYGNRSLAKMFYGCTSLISAPELLSMDVRDNAYIQMFYGCTSLINPPTTLPALSIANPYVNMFYGCTSLTRAPEIMATTYSSMIQMFYNCTNLSYVKVHFTTWNTTSNWMKGVSPNGTFVCPEALDTTTRSENRVPVGWTVETF